jgi:hypothetical protein
VKRLLVVLSRVVTGRRTTPVILGLFLLVYIGVAFFTEEALVTLMMLTRRVPLLLALLVMIPLNLAARLVGDLRLELRRGRALAGHPSGPLDGLFDEEVRLAGEGRLAELEAWLAGAGYRVKRGEERIAAVRGISAAPWRLLFRFGQFCLFLGILLSLTTRAVVREAVIEGEPLPAVAGAGQVQGIRLAAEPGGLILNKSLTVTVAVPSAGGGRLRSFGLYPPGLLNGAFFYPRYLGLAPLVQFHAPDLAGEAGSYYLLMLYPPGREDSATIPGTPYRIVFSLATSPGDEDPFLSGKFVLNAKLFRGEEPVAEGRLPVGGALERNGFRVAVPEVRQLVQTDFIRDSGVLLIWLAAALFAAAVPLALLILLLAPRREMLFRASGQEVIGYSRAEGRVRRHNGVFHEALDLSAPH